MNIAKKCQLNICSCPKHLLRRRLHARQAEATRLREMEHLYPPQQGSRRPEWSSAQCGRWSSLNGLPADQL